MNELKGPMNYTLRVLWDCRDHPDKGRRSYCVAHRCYLEGAADGLAHRL